MNPIAVISLQANFLATQAIAGGHRKIFRDLFLYYKGELEEMIQNTPEYGFEFTNDSWVSYLADYKNQKMEIYNREVVFKFSDGILWIVHIVALANLNIEREAPELMSDEEAFASYREKVLRDPIALVKWAQDDVNWNDIASIAECPEEAPNKLSYAEEWPKVSKTINTYKSVIKE